MNFECMGVGQVYVHWAGANVAVSTLRHPNDREEVFMPIGKSKPSQNSKLDKNKKPSKSSGEIRDDDLRSVSGGLANTGGVKISDDDGCITRIG